MKRPARVCDKDETLTRKNGQILGAEGMQVIPIQILLAKR